MGSNHKVWYWKNGLIGNIGNRGNKFRTSILPNLNSCLYELINFIELFATRFLIDTTGFIYGIMRWTLWDTYVLLQKKHIKHLLLELWMYNGYEN